MTHSDFLIHKVDEILDVSILVKTLHGNLPVIPGQIFVMFSSQRSCLGPGQNSFLMKVMSTQARRCLKPHLAGKNWKSAVMRERQELQQSSRVRRDILNLELTRPG